MSLPGISTTILDGGLGVTNPATSTPHVIGSATTGPSDTPTLIANQRQLTETFGVAGSLVDTVGYILDHGGGPVVATRSATSTPGTYDGGTNSSLTASTGGGTDNHVTVQVSTSAPTNDADLVVTVTTGGARTAALFTYSLDGGRTNSPPIAMAATVLLGNSGITLEFAAASVNPYVAGATYSSTVLGPMYTSTDLADVWTGVAASLLKWDFFVFAGRAHTASAAETLAAAIDTELAALLALDQPYGAMISAGADTASAVLTAFASYTTKRIAVLHGQFQAAPPVGAVGRALPYLPATCHAAARAAGNVMSTDLAQTFGADSVGPIPGCTGIDHDEFRANAGLDDAKIGTLRTYANLDGFYLTNCWLKSQTGSDFEFWQHRRIMDQAVKTVGAEHSRLISSNVVCKNDGTGQLTEAAARAIEKRVQRQLDNVIGSALRGVGPVTIDGSTGHVSDIRYQVDRQNNVLATKTLQATVSIVPRGYLKTLQTTFSYKLAT